MGPLLYPTLALPAAPVPPAHKTREHILIELIELPIGIPRTEVVAPPSKHGCQLRDDLLHVLPALPRIGHLSHTFPDSLHRLRRRPPLHEVPARIPLDTSLLAYRAPQEYKALPPAPQVHHPRLLRMQFESQPLHYQPYSPQRFPGLRFPLAHHHEVIAVPHQHPDLTTPRLPDPIQVVQIDVRQQRRDHSALRGSRQRLPPRPVFHPPRCQPVGSTSTPADPRSAPSPTPLGSPSGCCRSSP